MSYRLRNTPSPIKNGIEGEIMDLRSTGCVDPRGWGVVTNNTFLESQIPYCVI